MAYHISDGEISSGISLYYDSMDILNGGVADNITVNSGSWIYIYSGGTTNSSVVNQGGRIYVYSGGRHTGSLHIESGAKVMVFKGGVVDFTVAGRTEDDDYLINDLSQLQGTPSYTITVSEDQVSGTYKIAQGADAFEASISIGNGSEIYGTITVNGAVFVHENTYYSLDNIDGNLILTVDVHDVVPPKAPSFIVSNTEITEQNVTVTAIFSEDSVQKQYSFNGRSWAEYTADIVFEKNGKVFFRGIDAAGNISEVTEVIVDNIDKGVVYLFVSSRYNAGNVAGKKQNGVDLIWNENAFSSIYGISETAYNGEKIVLLDSKNKVTEFYKIKDAVYSAAFDKPVVTEKNGTYTSKLSVKNKGYVEVVNNNCGADFENFASVYVFRSSVGNVVGGKYSTVQSRNEVEENGFEIKTVNTESSVSAAGKFTASKSNSYISSILNYLTVTLEEGARAGLIQNEMFTLKEKERYVDGVYLEEHTVLRKVSAVGTVSLADGAFAESISGFKTVKLNNAFAGELIYGDSFTEKYSFKDGYSTHSVVNTRNGSVTAVDSEIGGISGYSKLKLTDSKAGNIYHTATAKIIDGVEVKKITGSVVLERSKVGNVSDFTSVTFADSSVVDISNVQKITISSGFNTIASYTGSELNDTLTIKKGAVLTIGTMSFVRGVQEKIVNNGTLILSSAVNINKLPIYGNGEICADDNVWQIMKNKEILNLGATAEGFRSIAYECADDTEKKASKWDLKVNYNGWLSGSSDVTDLVDFVKFKTGKKHQTLEISGFSAGDTFKLNDIDYTVSEYGICSILLDCNTNYVLEFSIVDGDDSMNYTLAMV